MAADDPPGMPPDLLAQLRGTLDRLNAVMARVPGVAQATAHLPALPVIPAPGALSAAQISAITEAVRAQRDTVAALRTSLDAFEQQLTVLQQLLEPLEQLSRTWAQIEHRIIG